MKILNISIVILLTSFLSLAETSEEILFDDSCEQSDKTCSFWQCYESGDCADEDLEEYTKFKKVKEARAELKKRSIDSAKLAEKGKMRFVGKESEHCVMHTSPDSESESVGRPLSSGKKLWTVASVAGWIKVFRRSGPAYVSSTCFD